MSACKFSWCEQSDQPSHDFHFGKLLTAKAGPSEVEVRVLLDPTPMTRELTYSFDMDWEISTGNLAHEMADLRSIMDQIEAAIVEAEAALVQELRL